jgi:EF-P beta-lysylation protein EpmB
MIPGSAKLRQVPRWQQALAQAITEPEELLRVLDLDPAWLPGARAAARLFPLRVPRGFVARMQRGDPHDPLLRQVLPLAEEGVVVPGFTSDPVGDHAAIRAPGVLQKYRGRVLLTATGACAVHCRYCFRRHFPYAEAVACADHWVSALAHIHGDASISEVILSGGDPLALTDRRLAEFAAALARIPHVQRLRLHTRLPIVLPERVDAALLAWLRRCPQRVTMVVHVNHPHEIDADVQAALAQFSRAGVILLNQSVLLRGVNDTAATLGQLNETLFAAGVLPYYLHQLDRVAGAAHFEVSDDTARTLMEQLRVSLPGYLVPRLVREVAGAPAKQPVFT